MKRILCTIAAIAAVSFSSMADEGMWLLPLLEKLNGKAMADLGCRLTPEQIYSINHSSIKDAVVIFGGGCTGEMISQEGLLVTNHHCGYGTIQKLSTPEHNYLEDGFFAMNRSEEIPAPGLSVVFLQSMTDVTDRVLDAEKKGQEARAAEIKKIVDLMLKIKDLGLDYNTLLEQAEDLYSKFGTDFSAEDLEEMTQGGTAVIIRKTVGKFFTNMFEKITGFFKGLLGK